MSTAVITGASFGIGEALSQELIQRGWTVIGLARSWDKLTAIQSKLGPSFIPIACDVAKPSEIKKASKLILEKKLCPTHFFLNAGMTGENAIENPESFDLSIHEKMMAVNYFGVLSFVEFWEKHAKENGGAHFIVTSSINAIFAPPAASAYSASKAAISKAFEGLSLTYLGTPLKFSTIYSGPVETKGLKGRFPFTWKPEKMAKYMADFAKHGRSHGEPSILYSLLFRLLRALPYRWTMKFLKKMS
jgi:3-hydroxy acid dehydrogenase/malonic semialdehyde reductase